MAEETKAPTATAEGPSGGGESHGPRPGGRGPRPGGPGGPREGGRKYFRRKKVCKFCVEKIDSVTYKDVRLLAQFVAESGKIVLECYETAIDFGDHLSPRGVLEHLSYCEAGFRTGRTDVIQLVLDRA